MASAAVVGAVWTSVDAARTKREIAHHDAQQRCASASDSNCQSLAVAIRAAAAAEDAATFAAQQLWLNLIGLFGVGGTILVAAFAWQEARRSADADNEALRATREAAAEARRDAVSQEARFKEQMEAAKGQLELSRKAHRIDQRPWVGIKAEKILQLKLRRGEGARLGISLKLENPGRTPAHAVAIYARLKSAEPPKVTVDDIERRFRNADKIEVPGDDMMCLLPGQEHETELTVVGLWEDLDAAMHHPLRMGLIFTLAGFVTYRSSTADGTELHATSFVYRISAAGEDRYIEWDEQPVAIGGQSLKMKRWPGGWLAD